MLYPITITAAQCSEFANIVTGDVSEAALEYGANLLEGPPVVTCSDSQVKVCGSFASSAEGAKLQAWIQKQAKSWLSTALGGEDACPAFLYGYNMTVTVGGDDGEEGEAQQCLSASTSVRCDPQSSVPFPKCR